MSNTTLEEGAVAPPSSPFPASPGGWLSTANPFYVISAALFLAGLRISFAAEDGSVEASLLMAGLGGYTLLLAATGWLLVRFAQVWDDARTVLLLVVVMFLATSVTFDLMLVHDTPRGIGFVLIALGFAIAVSEGVLRSTGVRLPLAYRLPYYLSLSLFFLYPIVLVPFTGDAHAPPIMWGLAAFPTVAGLVALTLLPAARLGPAYIRESGTPWPWPFYPWSLFIVLAAVVPARTFLLCKSFHLLIYTEYYSTIFGPYLLVPFGLAIAAVVLEIGLATPRPIAARVAMSIPLALVVLAGTGHRQDPIFQTFLGLIEQTVHSGPVYLAALLAVGFYLYALIRRAPEAVEWLTASVIVVGLLEPGTSRFAWSGTEALPWIGLAAGLQAVIGLWQRNPIRVLAGVAGLAVILVLIVPAELRLIVGYHLAAIFLLLAGAVLPERFAQPFRAAGTLGLMFAAIVVVVSWGTAPRMIAIEWRVAYPVAVVLFLGVYVVLVRDWFVALVAAAVGLCWFVAVILWGYVWLRTIVAGLDYIAISAAAFLAALGISLSKSGMLTRPASISVPISTTPSPPSVSPE